MLERCCHLEPFGYRDTEWLNRLALGLPTWTKSFLNYDKLCEVNQVDSGMPVGYSVYQKRKR